ncbi:biotin--[acetyl-CoA-carboxylase] ligase [Cardiobacteriales bacterium ML27]|uniref:Biotin--[acetyl-CoA-carboxylase] ligase n=1 Tax=Ostreibacterium oceani TaxID=2654998 RepID=A0A6N7EU18_9GAMM|nr:biotin--[acetyl-CoA-carboxylase] ligase [Ostreibacterium oceani]
MRVKERFRLNPTPGLHPEITWRHVDTIDSTNATLLATDTPLPYLLSTDYQTQGRGQRGRVWSNPEKSLMFSLAFALPITAEKLALWQLVVALTLVEQFSQTVDTQAFRIKWPNDIYVNGSVNRHQLPSHPLQSHQLLGEPLSQKTAAQWGKCAGILVENQLGFRNKVVTGIGINLAPVALSDTRYASGYVDIGCDKYIWLVQLVNSLYAAWQRFCEAPYLDVAAYAHYDLLAGKMISAVDSKTNQTVAGVCLGVDAQGALHLSNETGIQVLTAAHQIQWEE